MRRTLLFRYLQIVFLIILGSINFLNAIKTGNIIDWVVYAACMVGIIVIAFSIKKVREEHYSSKEVAAPVSKNRK